MTCHECTHNTPTTIRDCIGCTARLFLSLRFELRKENIERSKFDSQLLMDEMKRRYKK